MAEQTTPPAPKPSVLNADLSMPLFVSAAAVGISLATPPGAIGATLTLGGIGVKSLLSDRASGSGPAKEPAISPSTDPLGNMYEYDAGCVEVRSRLPGKVIAGEVSVGDALQLADEQTLEFNAGVVSYSERKAAKGYRIVAEGDVSLVCSDTAPIPTPEGIVLAPELAGKQVAVRIDDGGVIRTEWRRVTAVDPIGEIEVQHITVGNKCFWAGEKAGAYILHHNMKAALVGGSVYNDWW